MPCRRKVFSIPGWLIAFSLLGATIAMAIDPLTDAEKKLLADTEVAIRRSPKMKEATEIFNQVRKLYQLDRQKFPADREASVSKKYREALKAYETSVKNAMRDSDPKIAALLWQQAELTKLGMVKANEGETLADSDSTVNRAILPIKDEPNLPRVLLIGDSISIGYTLAVREKLKGRANVHRIPQNGGATDVGLEKMEAWLGDGKWDVIHFNFGLHDAKYASETTQRASREQYAENLQKLVAQMKKTGARLIFATTTPVPKNGILTPTRKFDSIVERNAIAVALMQSNDVAIDDLYKAVLPVQEEVGRPNDVHYSPEGYEVLAKAVASSIEIELAKRR